MKKKTGFIALLSVFAISGATAGAAMISGCNKIEGIIDAPATLEEELGAYVIPDYEVIDEDGMVLAGYNVYLKSVTNADGEELAEKYGSAVTVDEAGVYSFVYSAGSKNVEDVTVSIDFADRTAPTINCDDSAIPKFFIKGNSYKYPQYTLSGDFDRSRCWAKVYHIDEDKKETEVKIDGGRFLVDKDSGSYAIRIHVEDASGNANDYEYVRKVDGPETVVENKVLYLDEEFGERQISCYQSSYTGAYVSKDEDGAHTYKEENGAYKVSFSGKDETRYNEGLLVMDVPAIIDINEYEDLYMYVYNDSGKDIVMGSQWWNDTAVPAGKWTKLTWKTRDWGNNVSASNTKPIGTVDISGMTIRFIFNYDQTEKPAGDFYLSAMYATPKVRCELEISENVILNGTKYYINDTVELNAAPVDGKTVDYYKVDGEIIPGNKFVITQDCHTIEVFYKDGELTKDNMTWAEPEELNPEGSDTQIQYMGTDDYWVMSYDVYGVNDGWRYFGAYVGGSNQLLGFELIDGTHSKLSGYGGAWKWMSGVTLTPEIYNVLRSATKENPVKAVYVRLDGEIRVYLINGDKNYFVGSVEFLEFGVSGNNFGYGTRKPGENLPQPATVENFKAVAGEVKTRLYFETFTANLTVDGVKVEGKHYLGDKVNLTAGEAPDGKMFAYFTVNGVRLYENEFNITSKDTVVEFVYTDAVTVKLGEGVKTVDGKTGTVQVAQDSYLTLLDYTGTAPAGKYYVGFTLNGELFEGNEILITADNCEIDVLFRNKIQTGNDKLNDISDTDKVIYALNKDGTVKWAPASIEHVTDFRFSGSDGAVDENSVIKIITGDDDGENSFAFDTAVVSNLDQYMEIYFYVYTEARGLKAGGWWIGDTDLVAGKWTKVSFSRDLDPKDIIGNGTASVWEAGINKFAYRIFKAPANATVYVTAVYGVPYPDAVVTKSEDVTVSAPANGNQYKVGETVTLTANKAPEGKVFAYFTANGEPIEGDKYVLTEKVVFGAVYNEYSTVSLADGIETVDGQKGTVRVARNMPVYLKLTDSTKYYVSFSVDGKAISGNSFTPTEGKTYTVTVETADRTENGNSQVNSVTSSAMHSGSAKLEFTDHIFYNGADGAVTEDGSLRITNIGGDDIAVKATKKTGEACLTEFKEVYFYIYTEDEGVMAGTYWCNDTSAVKGQWTKVSVYSDSAKNTNNNYNADGVNGKLFAEGSYGSNFVYRIMGGKGKTVYITSLYGVPLQDATVKIADDSKDSLNVSAPANGTGYKEGETVTLTAAEAPEGKAFAYFTANGKRIEGNKYLLTAGEVTFGVVYSNISTVTLGEGVTAENAEDGKVTVGRGATVTLEFDGEVPAGKYFAGFSVDGKTIEGNTFIAEEPVHSVEAVFEDKIQTGNVKLNEISTVDTDGLSYHSNESWKPEKTEYVTTVKYSGSDGAVDENGSLKVTLKGGEQAFALNKTLVNTLDEYKEIYFYVYAEKDADVTGMKIGGWWCRDTAIVAGQWTKVSFSRKISPWNIAEKSVWDENSIDKFVYSFDKAVAGTEVYLTAVYGVLYGEVSVTVEDSVKDLVTVTGIFREGQTVTFAHGNAPDNKQFVHYTVNGEKYDKNTYTLGTEAIVVGAYFTDAKATLTLGDGVATSDGETVYALGVDVTLEVDGKTAPENKVFDRFEVDGKAIEGNTFTTTSATHEVTAVFINNVSEMTWSETAYEEPDGVIDSWGKYKKLGSAEDWVLSYDITATNANSTANAGIPNQWYAGVMFRNNQIVGFHIGDNKDHSQWLGSAGSGAGSTWDKMQPSLGEVLDILKSADKDNPVTLIFVRQGNKLSSYVKCGENIYLVIRDKADSAFDTKYGLDFGYGWRTDCGGTPDIENIKWVTGEGKTGLYLNSLTADIEYTKATAEKESYLLGDTVTLIADEAEEGKKFLQFTVNGKAIEGDTFEVTSNVLYEVVAIYSDISELTLGKGVRTADGQTEYARGTTVTLTVDSASAEGIIDYFTVDGTRIVGNKFVASEATYSVDAVFVSNASEMTWTDGGSAYNYETVMGADSAEWKSRNLDGEVYGSSEYWAVSVDVKLTTEWNSLEFILGSKQSLRIRFHSANYFGIVLMVDGSETYPGSEFLPAYPHQNAQIVAKLKAGTTITCVRIGDTLKMYADNYQFFVSKCGFDHSGEWFGVGYVNAEGATKPEMTNTKFLTLREKVEAYTEGLADLPEATQKSENQINNIYGATVKDGSATEYITAGIPEGLLDSNVKEEGVLKVTAASSDIGIIPVWTFDCNPGAYSELYYYVYMESDEELNHVGAGAYWKDKTELVANKWVKVVLDSEMIAALADGANADLSKITLRIYSKNWEAGYTPIQGKTFYVTSLYGVPKGTEPLVENKTTGYSVVSVNEDLTAILNDNFFPDAE